MLKIVKYLFYFKQTFYLSRKQNIVENFENLIPNMTLSTLTLITKLLTKIFTMKKLFLLGFTAALLAVSCTVQKRLHNPGYHVTWKNKYQSIDKNDFASKESGLDDKKANSEDVASLENAKEIENEPFVIINSENSNDSFSYTTTELEKKNNSSLNSAYKSLNSSRGKNTMSKYMAIKKIAKKSTKSTSSDADVLLILLVVLCFFIPPLSVGIASDWDLTKLLISILLTVFFWIPGVIYALYIVLKDKL